MNWIKCTDRLPRKEHTVLAGIYGSNILWREEGETVEQCRERLRRKVKRVAFAYLDELGFWNTDEGFPLNPEPSVWMEIPPLPEWDDIGKKRDSFCSSAKTSPSGDTTDDTIDCPYGDDFDCQHCLQEKECYEHDS